MKNSRILILIGALNSRSLLTIAVALIVIPFFLFAFLYASSFIFALLTKIGTSDVSYDLILEYQRHYGHEQYVMKRIKEAYTLIAMLFIILATFLVIFFLKPSKRDLYGRSRLATNQEALMAFKTEKFGVLCGQIGKIYLTFGGTQHILMEAPSRSGKGVGFVIPNCLNYGGSLVVLDIKGENYGITSEYRRQHGHAVFMWNPIPHGIIDSATCEYTYEGHRYNPLGYISENENKRIDDIQQIANFLYPDGNSKNPFFTQQARLVFFAIVLYIFDNSHLPVTLSEVFRQSLKLSDKEYFSRICNERYAQSKEDKGITPIHVMADRIFKTFASFSDNTASSVMGTVTARLEAFANPILDAATSANDFDLRELRKRKMSVYVVVTPDNLDRLAFLINIFFQHCFDLNLRELPEQNPEIRYHCLFLLDEFTSLGPIPSISKGIAYFAGYWLRLGVIIQSVAQLTAVYGEAVKDTFVTNLALRIVFAPKEVKVAQEISESLGYITETSASSSRSKNKGVVSTSESQSAVKRAVLWPHELREIGAANQILITDNIPPVLCKKIVYWKDPVFKERLFGPAPIPVLTVPKIVDDREQEVKPEEIETVVVNTPEALAKITASNVNVSNYDYSKFVLPGINAPLDTPPDATKEQKDDQVKMVLENFRKATFLNDNPASSNSSSDNDEDDINAIGMNLFSFTANNESLQG